MTIEPTTLASSSVFRIDRFAVPADALARFVAQLHSIDRLLADMPGCKQHQVLSRADEAEAFNVMTIVEWASEEAMRSAKAVVQQHYAEAGFDPAAFMRELGVRPDFANYKAI
ncbi:hypothetical protein JHS3_08290 [Jeongeupia sp. HS-3]|uniref:antibiotic biosynthesis monooxygenase family protein n=1 Tax=Jeongeupia sp. HS-3 TaxID=1009682 RepID=UPI0018A6345C|nr:antibiotic biosynthesis monooxygenase [Jeongeupia sp. HS-3]BCL75093.1 hypothetical protein JHS3_08290 [Jeongeupia sp. HS-3]